jgi:hypothetical protein
MRLAFAFMVEGESMSTSTAQWIEVDKDGLAAQLERRGKSFVLLELYQNGVDENTSVITMDVERSQRRGHHVVRVVDDSPDGFADLKHAWTMFAKSPKAANPEKRGRYDVGEKLVLALCREAEIASTTGTVLFDDRGRHHRPRRKRQIGTSVTAEVRMTIEEAAEALETIRRVIPPKDVRFVVNGEVIGHREPLASFEATLPTEYADEDGLLHRTARKTIVNVFEPLEGEEPSVYELGIPVVSTGDDKWHYDVMQRVPLGLDRDNVPPALLRSLRVFAANALHGRLSEDDAAASWAREAAGDTRVDPNAFERLQTLRWGEKRVMQDPSDPEANLIAASKGFTVIPAGGLSRFEHANNRRLMSSKPAGQVTPSPKPYSPDGDPLDTIEESKWTPGMRRCVAYAKAIAPHLIGRQVDVVIGLGEVGWNVNATFGPGAELMLNLRCLGHRWFDSDRKTWDKLLIHEFAHETVHSHLSEDFYKECCNLGSKLVTLALEKPVVLHVHSD